MSAEDRNEAYPAALAGAADKLRDMVKPPRLWADDQPSVEQIAIYRRITPGRRLEIAEQLYWSARRMKVAWLRSLHSDWALEQVEHEVTHLFSHARS